MKLQEQIYLIGKQAKEASKKLAIVDSKIKIDSLKEAAKEINANYQSIINAAKDLNLKLPVIVRFQGTNAEEGRNIINTSGLNIIAANSLTEAAKKSIQSISK